MPKTRTSLFGGMKARSEERAQKVSSLREHKAPKKSGYAVFGCMLSAFQTDV